MLFICRLAAVTHMHVIIFAALELCACSKSAVPECFSASQWSCQSHTQHKSGLSYLCVCVWQSVRHLCSDWKRDWSPKFQTPTMLHCHTKGVSLCWGWSGGVVLLTVCREPHTGTSFTYTLASLLLLSVCFSQDCLQICPSPNESFLLSPLLPLCILNPSFSEEVL